MSSWAVGLYNFSVLYLDAFCLRVLPAAEESRIAVSLDIFLLQNLLF